MKLNEKKILEYLENHIGYNTTAYLLIEESGGCEEGFETDFELYKELLKIAKRNGYRLNSHHHDFEEIGLPWNIDFYIEVANVDKDITRIGNHEPRIVCELIEQEYGIYDYNGTLIGFRTSIPYRIKQFYDETGEMLKEYERQGILID